MARAVKIKEEAFCADKVKNNTWKENPLVQIREQEGQPEMLEDALIGFFSLAGFFCLEHNRGVRR